MRFNSFGRQWDSANKQFLSQETVQWIQFEYIHT
jgi:hypothetical protein